MYPFHELCQSLSRDMYPLHKVSQSLYQGWTLLFIEKFVIADMVNSIRIEMKPKYERDRFWKFAVLSVYFQRDYRYQQFMKRYIIYKDGILILLLNWKYVLAGAEMATSNP